MAYRTSKHLFSLESSITSRYSYFQEVRYEKKNRTSEMTSHYVLINKPRSPDTHFSPEFLSQRPRPTSAGYRQDVSKNFKFVEKLSRSGCDIMKKDDDYITQNLRRAYHAFYLQLSVVEVIWILFVIYIYIHRLVNVYDKSTSYLPQAY